jgi:protein subunit release factor A
MLERVADRLDVRLETETSTTTARVYRLPFGVKLPRELDREVGIHRAQLVPDRSVSGRVVTAKVTVTIEPKRDRGTSAHVIKTYSYPTNRVTLHETGEVLAMDVVLAGLAV